MQISALQPQDVEEAAVIAALCLGDDLYDAAIDDFNATFEKASYVPKTFVAKKDGKIVGLVQSVNGYIYSNLRAFAWLFTAPEYRHQGIASALLAFAEKDAIDTHFRGSDGTFLLHCSTDPKFFEALGYEGNLPSHDGRPFLVKHYKA